LPLDKPLRILLLLFLMPQLNNQKIKIYLWVVFVLVLVITISLLILSSRQKTSPPSLPAVPKESQTSQEEKIAIPTLSPEKVEIVSKIETHNVEIKNNQFNPQSLQIKLHDQVKWVNNDNKTHKISGEDWGNVPIENGESFIQAFDKRGTYPYSCALHPEMKGTIIVE
jgi:plastocyanin